MDLARGGYTFWLQKDALGWMYASQDNKHFKVQDNKHFKVH